MLREEAPCPWGALATRVLSAIDTGMSPFTRPANGTNDHVDGDRGFSKTGLQVQGNGSPEPESGVPVVDIDGPGTDPDSGSLAHQAGRAFLGATPLLCHVPVLPPAFRVATPMAIQQRLAPD